MRAAEFIPGVSTPVPDGLSEHEVFTALGMLRGWITSMDVVEYVPRRDLEGKTGDFAARIIGELFKE